MKRALALCVIGFVPLVAWGARPYRGGVVATAHPYASEAALFMLNKGGNAVDAAIAAAFVLGVVDPTHSGLGGGGFALVFDAKSQQTRVLDFREVAPEKASRDMFLRNGKAVPELSRDGALSVAVPGAVAGYFQLLQKYGKLKPSVVLAPAIRAARQGFLVTPNYQRMAGKRRSCLVAHSATARIFLRQNKDGFNVPPIGTLIRQPDLARTLELLAKSGPSAFYTGPIARRIATTIKVEGGILSGADLARFKTTWRNPLEGSYRGHRILTMPPPSAGGLAVLQVLGIMELQEPKGFDFHDPEAIHVYAEALRRSFVDRAKFLGDPAFVEIPLQRLSSREYIAQLSSTIDRSKATPSRSLLPTSSRADATTPSGSMNTTHLSILDREGNAVALTTTINYYFGSCLIAKGTGILLNDEMDDFAAAPLVPNVYDLVTGEANAVAPGKIPLSSLSPTFVFQQASPSKVMMVLGAAGGPTIPSSVIQVISNVIDQHMDLTRAVGQGRIHHQFMPDWIKVDAYGLDPATIKILEAKGHRVVHDEDWGDVHAVMENPQTHLRYAASDPRYEGMGTGQD